MNSSLKKYAGLLTLASLGFFGSANAQHGGNREGGGQSRSFDRGGNTDRRSGGGFSQSPSYGRQSGGSFDRQNTRGAVLGQPTVTTTPRQNRSFDNNGSYSRSYPSQRSVDTRVNNRYDRVQDSRNVTVYNNRVNNTYRYPTSRYNYPRAEPYRYNYAPRRYVYVGAPRYSVLPHGYFSIHFGGYPYYYYGGSFFNYYNGFYEPVYAPVGIHVSVIPGGCYPVFVGPSRYYYYEGTYYRQYTNNDYEVVDAPVGAQVSVLPKGAKSVTVNSEKFYEFNGTYYKEGVNEKSEVVYTVVGKYGNINNTNEEPVSAAPQSLQLNDVVITLPEGSKEVVINGEHLYVSPDNIYFRAQSINGELSYKVVGTPSDNQ